MKCLCSTLNHLQFVAATLISAVNFACTGLWSESFDSLLLYWICVIPFPNHIILSHLQQYFLVVRVYHCVNSWNESIWSMNLFIMCLVSQWRVIYFILPSLNVILIKIQILDYCFFLKHTSMSKGKSSSSSFQWIVSGVYTEDNPIGTWKKSYEKICKHLSYKTCI
jgi:hypothetical protein